MQIDTYFADFLHAISPTSEQIKAIQNAHIRLRERVMGELTDVVETTFLQGSYARETMICPDGQHRPDVDVAVVTRLSWRDVHAVEALHRFEPFARRHYHDKWRPQRRVIGIDDQIDDQDVHLDLAIMALPVPGGAGWKEAGRLMLPNREVGAWGETNPIGQMDFASRKKAATSGHYQGVVRALKWWKRRDSMPRRPGSYPLEHLIGVCCPDGITSVAQGVVETLERLVQAYGLHKPVLYNHGVRHDVLERVSDGEFEAFINQARYAARIARRAYDEEDLDRSADLWRDLFGERFPVPAARQVVTHGGRWG